MIQTVDKPCWPLEVIHLLSKEVSDDYDKIMTHPEKFGKKEAEMEAMFKPYLNYKKAVLPEILEIFSHYESMKRYLLTKEEKKYDLFMAIVIASLDNSNFETLVINNIESKSYQKRCLVMVLSALLEEEIDIDYYMRLKEFEDPAYVIRRMESLELADEIKFKYMDLYLNIEALLIEFYKMMAEMILCLKKHFYLVEEEYNHRAKELSNPKFLEYLQNGSSGLSFEFKDDAVYKVNMSIFQYNGLAYMNMDHMEEDYILVYIGMYFQELVAEKKKKNCITDSEMTTVCKALGDGNRYKMLKLFLKNEKMYLQELAKEIGVTPATVSHHISLLMEAELITMLLNEKEKKLVYYQANRERLQQLSETFLNMVNIKE